MLGQPNALGLVTGPVLVLFSAIAVYGLALLLIEWAFRGQKPAPAAFSPTTDTEPDDIPGEEPVHTIKTFRRLAREGAGLLIALIAVELVLDLWGLSFTEPGSLFYALWEVVLVLFLAYLAFQSVKIWIDRKIVEEGGLDGERTRSPSARKAPRKAPRGSPPCCRCSATSS